MSDLYLPDSPEGRAIEQVAAALAAPGQAGRLRTVKRLSRIAWEAMIRLVGPEETCEHFSILGREAAQRRGRKHT